MQLDNIKSIISKSNLLATLILFLIFILDRISKIKIIEILENKDILIINNFLNFNLTFNTGIGFSLFNTQEEFYYNLISFFIFCIILFIFYLMYKSDNFEKFCFSLIIGGGTGNLYDRIVYSSVADFIDFHVNSYHWFTFNIADIFITLGVILILIKEILIKK